MAGILDCKLDWYPKFYNHVILCVGLKTFSTFIGFRLVGSMQSQNFSINNFNLQNGNRHLGMYINFSPIRLSSLIFLLPAMTRLEVGGGDFSCEDDFTLPQNSFKPYQDL